MDRFWISPDHWKEPFALRGEEARHCRRVMRKRVGDLIEVFDGNGHWARGKITKVEKEVVELQIEESGETAPLLPKIEIAVGIPKGKTFDLVIQKAVELGVDAIYPILSDQGMVKVSPDEAPKKRAKWERVALEACKQCGQNHLPKIGLPTALPAYLDGLDQDSLKVVGALLPGVVTLKEALGEKHEDGSIALLVGPEGDFSQDEYALIQSNHYRAVSLGPLVLRVETAILAMIASVRFQFQTKIVL